MLYQLLTTIDPQPGKETVTHQQPDMVAKHPNQNPAHAKKEATKTPKCDRLSLYGPVGIIFTENKIVILNITNIVYL